MVKHPGPGKSPDMKVSGALSALRHGYQADGNHVRKTRTKKVSGGCSPPCPGGSEERDKKKTGNSNTCFFPDGIMSLIHSRSSSAHNSHPITKQSHPGLTCTWPV